MSSQTSNPLTVSVEGKAVTQFNGNMMGSAMFGRTVLTLSSVHLVEETKFMILKRDTIFPLTEIDSVSMMMNRSNTLLVIGLLTLGLFGLGLIFLLAYIFYAEKFLVIRSKANFVALHVKGDDTDHHSFMKTLVKASIAAKKHK